MVVILREQLIVSAIIRRWAEGHCVSKARPVGPEHGSCFPVGSCQKNDIGHVVISGSDINGHLSQHLKEVIPKTSFRFCIASLKSNLGHPYCKSSDFFKKCGQYMVMF
ncbi:hypothetical protein BGZ61DRAFT_478115 [Ilyonectria robusta]|uniref:uncharacterized protein n=1 Tax=Ilyonectria robusta TaxID=1079257 RepID=UPI001E8CD89C|nr:uncharacterized protein BGZ61DRAFT_478115 [Ilyonectria robusta]KAH8694505.1 hypothetical protein BGZ61DRAFT_478115 [Ilyonectria robusta]